jgi:uncharacterized membrane protein
VTEHTRWHSWRRLALPASLVLNCFLLALIGGHLWRGQETPVARILSNIEGRLGERDASAFRSVMQRAGPRLAAAAKDVGDDRRSVKAALEADPYDKEAAKRALAAWRVSGNRFLDEFGDTLIDALAEVSPEGRRKVVENRVGDQAGR